MHPKCFELINIITLNLSIWQDRTSGSLGEIWAECQTVCSATGSFPPRLIALGRLIMCQLYQYRGLESREGNNNLLFWVQTHTPIYSIASLPLGAPLEKLSVQRISQMYAKDKVIWVIITEIHPFKNLLNLIINVENLWFLKTKFILVSKVKPKITSFQ